jgi:hypothetical protein
MKLAAGLSTIGGRKRTLLIFGALGLSCLPAAGCGDGSESFASKRTRDVLESWDDDDDDRSSGKKTRKGGGANSSGVDGSDSGSDADSVGLPLTETDAFATTVYPLLVKQCGSCHAAAAAPFFSQATAEASRLSVLDSGKVNFSAVERSRLYLRLAADNHNCWSLCTDNAAEMKAAIDQWLRLLTEMNPNFLSELDDRLVTSELLFANAEQRTPTPDPMTVVVEAEAATLTAPMAVVADAEASGGSYIEVPTGNGGTINNANQANAGTSVFTIMAPAAGSYKVWALLNAATDANNAFFVRMDNGAFAQWATPVTMAEWMWAPANTQNGQAELSFDLTAGAHTLEIKRRDVSTKIDRVAVTANVLFDGSQADNRPVRVLRYDISALAGKPNTFFEIEVADFSEQAFKLRKPTIVSEQALTVKGIRILINGQYNPQHNTYNLVDAAVTPPRTELSTAAMVVLKEQGLELDKLSFTFEALQ